MLLLPPTVKVEDAPKQMLELETLRVGEALTLKLMLVLLLQLLALVRRLKAVLILSRCVGQRLVW